MKRILKYLGIAIVAILALIPSTIGIARAILPPTACEVSEAQIETLVLEKMSYNDVKSALGCAGILTKKEDFSGQLLIETYAWRGTAWPYATFEGEFINGVMHGKTTTWFTIKFTEPKADAPQSAGTGQNS